MLNTFPKRVSESKNATNAGWMRQQMLVPYLPYLVVLTNPLAAYLLDLRLAQTLGDRPWLDDFRILQAVQIAAVIAGSTLFPQLVVPKLAPLDSFSAVDWDAVRRIQKTMACLLLSLLALAMIAPGVFIGLLKYQGATAGITVLWAPARVYFVCIAATVSTGVTASCLLALGSDTALYLISTAASVGAILAIQIHKSQTSLLDICLYSAGGSLLLWAYSSLALYRQSIRRIDDNGTTKSSLSAGVMTKGDLQQILALIAGQTAAIVLNKVLSRGEPGTVRDYSFAFKIVSVGMLPCVVGTNRLLKSMGVDRRASKMNLNYLTNRAVIQSYLYAFTLTGSIFLVHNYILRVVFFKARFNEAQYQRMGSVLFLLALGLPALSQLYVWFRVNAVRDVNHFTLASAMACLAIIGVISRLQSPINSENVAILWTLGVTVQALLLIVAKYVGPGFADEGRGSRGSTGAVFYSALCVAVGALIWLANARPQWQIGLVGCLNMLFVIHFVATGRELLKAKTSPTTLAADSI